MKKLFFITVFAVALTVSFSLLAGTIFFKDGTKLSGVKIISISDGEVVIEKSKTRKTYHLKQFKAYYDTDINTGDQSSPDKYVDYGVNILNIKVPDMGIDSKKKAESVEIEYTISKKTGTEKKFKVPYFYLYVLTTKKKGDGERQIYSYYTPTAAKPKNKGYDVASILVKVLGFSRPEVSLENAKARNNLMGKTVKISLKNLGVRKVLAWHLEIWGNSDAIYKKTEVKVPGIGIGKNWWKRLK